MLLYIMHNGNNSLMIYYRINVEIWIDSLSVNLVNVNVLVMLINYSQIVHIERVAVKKCNNMWIKRD